MKKWLLIFLAFQLLATSSPTLQGMQGILKVGAFFHHFLHHITCHQEKIGIVDFVELHYSDHVHHEEDQSEHENLPFQHHHHDHNFALQSPGLLPQSIENLAFTKPTIASTGLNVHEQQWLSSLFLGDIWQPPKA